jgi:hypothetical protein
MQSDRRRMTAMHRAKMAPGSDWESREKPVPFTHICRSITVEYAESRTDSRTVSSIDGIGFTEFIGQDDARRWQRWQTCCHECTGTQQSFSASALGATLALLQWWQRKSNGSRWISNDDEPTITTMASSTAKPTATTLCGAYG